MDALESLLRPAASLLNRNIRQSTPARELCEELAGTVAAVRVKDTGLATYFRIHEDSVELTGSADGEPDIAIAGSMLTLARVASGAEEEAIRDGSLELIGDPEKAQAFQKLLKFAKPDVEEEVSRFFGDTIAHGAGEFARGVERWARDARSTMGMNIREYLQEESRDVPSRYEVERFTTNVNRLRDDVDRLEARIDRLGDDD